MEFTKPPRSISEQLEILSYKGKIIDNPSKAEKFLLHVNYYRFYGYAWNRRFAPVLTLFKSKKNRIDNKKLAGYIFVLHELLKPLGRRQDFTAALKELFDNYQDISKEPMGCKTFLSNELRLNDE